jgi:hypothetical protein
MCGVGGFPATAVDFTEAGSIAVANKLLAEMDRKRDGKIEEDEFLEVCLPAPACGVLLR